MLTFLLGYTVHDRTGLKFPMSARCSWILGNVFISYFWKQHVLVARWTLQVTWVCPEMSIPYSTPQICNVFTYHGKSDFVMCYPLGCMVFLKIFRVPTYNFRYLSSSQLPLLGEVCYLQWWSTGFRRPITARANAFLRRLRKMLCRSCAPGQDIQMLGTRLPSRCQRQQELLPMLLQSVRGRTLLKFR